MTNHQTPFDALRVATGRDLQSLSAARARTVERLAARRQLFANVEHDDDVAVVLLGSWGRHELTSGSDDDSMVLVHGERRTAVQPTADQLAQTLAQDNLGARGPGREGTFGEVVFTTDLVENIGLDRETNSNLTRRVLLMLESEWLTGQAVHADARCAIIAGYLRDTVKDFRPPRFLLNDLIRYWRTIGVDFVAKDRTRDGKGWGLRNAKLRTSRKLLFVSGLLPVLRCHELRREEMLDFLLAQYGMPPVDRIADCFMHYRALADGVAALVAYDQFLSLIDDATVREELDAVSSANEAAASRHFDAVARLGVALDGALLNLLFSPALLRWTRDFAIL